MDKIRERKWFSFTAYILAFMGVWALLFYLAETYYPSEPQSPYSNRDDRSAVRPSQSPGRQDSPKTDVVRTAGQEKLFLLLNQKMYTGKSELIYRGLAGQSEFRIDVIVPELDPLAAYSYRIKISEAKKSFRLANRNYQMISARKGALQLKVIDPE